MYMSGPRAILDVIRMRKILVLVLGFEPYHLFSKLLIQLQDMHKTNLCSV